MPAGNYTSLLKAITTQWGSTSALTTIPFYYGRVDQSVKTFPRATVFAYNPDQPEYGYSTGKFLTTASIQFDVWYENDPNGCGVAMEAIHSAFHRQFLTLDTGTVLIPFRKGSQLLVDPELSVNSNDVFHGVVRFSYTIDTP